MPIPDSIRTAAEAHLDQYIANLIPKHVQDKLRIGYVAKGMAITLFEQRPHWKDKALWLPPSWTPFKSVTPQDAASWFASCGYIIF